MKKCLDKKKLLQRIACLGCPLRLNPCKMSQELIDSNIFLRVYFEEKGKEECKKLLDKNNILYIGYVTTIQVSHILRRFNENLVKIENGTDRNKFDKITKIELNRDEFIKKLKDFHIIDFDDDALGVFRVLNEENSLRMELHDKMNIAIAISKKFNVQTRDTNLAEDFQTIEDISSGFGHNIKFNQEI